MADKNISRLKIGGVAYDVKDKVARDLIANAKPTTATATLSAASWTNQTYSFESVYPNATYDLVVNINGDSCTSAQYEAWCAAAIQGSPTTNILKAFGTVPTIDIPIVIEYQNK